MILQLIQLLLSFNNFNLNTFHNQYPTLPHGDVICTLATSKHEKNNNDNDSNDDNNNKDNDNNNNDENESENENPLATMEFSSPSTMSKPHHYFHLLKQSSTVVLSSPTLDRDILVRLSLLIDLFMRISFCGVFVPSFDVVVIIIE